MQSKVATGSLKHGVVGDEVPSDVTSTVIGIVEPGRVFLWANVGSQLYWGPREWRSLSLYYD